MRTQKSEQIALPREIYRVKVGEKIKFKLVIENE